MSANTTCAAPFDIKSSLVVHVDATITSNMCIIQNMDGDSAWFDETLNAEYVRDCGHHDGKFQCIKSQDGEYDRCPVK